MEPTSETFSSAKGGCNSAALNWTQLLLNERGTVARASILVRLYTLYYLQGEKSSAICTSAYQTIVRCE